MAEQTTPPAGRRELSRRQVYVLRTAWLVVTAAVVVGAGAVAGQALLPVLGPWAMVVQTTVSLGLMVPAGWFYEDVVAWLRGYLERRAR